MNEWMLRLQHPVPKKNSGFFPRVSTPETGQWRVNVLLGAGGIWVWISAELLTSHSFCYYSNRLRILPALSPTLEMPVCRTSLSGGQLFFLFLFFFSMMFQWSSFFAETKRKTKQGLRIMERQRKILFWLEGHFQSFVPWRGMRWGRNWGLIYSQ